MSEKNRQSTKYQERYDAVTHGLDGADIGSIETLIRRYQAESFEARVNSFCCLQYLKRTSRFREDPRYKEATFAEYLESVYGIRYESFRDMRRAIIYHYDEAGAYGVGTITEIMRKCGRGKVKKVIGEIEAEAKKHGGATHSIIKRMIKKHETAKPTAPPKPPEADYRTICESLRASLREKDEEIAELKAQIARQVGAIGRLKEKCATLESEIARLQREIVGTPDIEAKNGAFHAAHI